MIRAVAPGPRVLIVVTSAQRRGAEIEGAGLATQLAARGVPTRVVALSGASFGTGLDVEVLGPAPLSITSLRALRRAATDCDVVVAYGSTTLPACALALLAHRTAFVYRSIGDPTRWAGGRARRRRTGWMMKRASRIVALWPGAAQAIEDLYGIDPAAISVVGNARDGEWLRAPTGTERTAARTSFGFGDSPVVAVIGSLSDEKRVDLALRTVALVPDATAFVVGDGELRGELERLADELLADRHVFTGVVDEIREVLWAADAVLLTSRTEGIPGVLVEAVLCGVRVVATDVGGVRQQFEGQPNVHILDADPAPALVAATLTEALSAPLRPTSGDGRFGWDDVCSRWTSLFDAIAGGQRSAV